jgi:hypothetical protein
MRFLVGRQVGALGKPFVTVSKTTDIGLFSSVGPEVRTQIEIKAETLVANVASVGLLTSVNKLVSLQFTVVQKLLTTSFYGASEHALTVGH